MFSEQFAKKISILAFLRLR